MLRKEKGIENIQSYGAQQTRNIGIMYVIFQRYIIYVHVYNGNFVLSLKLKFFSDYSMRSEPH